MKKIILGLTLIAALALAFSITSVVTADTGEPPLPSDHCGLVDNILKIDGCGFGRPDGARLNDGILHDYMLEVYSDKLGISVSELETRISGGETMADIALDEGLTLEDFRTWMLDARSQAIDLAVADGALSEEQAEWMKTRGGMMFGGTGRKQGSGMMGRSGRMGGFGTGACPNLP
ncbi:MAG: hypothetical protein JXR32_09150 [Anaerolineaceae bacterium]|nr:hypothetical protein [Anaerolineaceae bacterium]